MESEERLVFIEYISAAMRYATEEVGRSVDFSRFILLLPSGSSFGRDTVLGFNVFCLERCGYDFMLSCPWDCTGYEERVTRLILEYQEQHSLSDFEQSNNN